MLKAFGFSDALIVHGSSNLVHGKISIVSGPSGIGKSVVSRRLDKKGHPQIEEGWLLIGRRGNKLFLVETGVQEHHSSQSKLVLAVRNTLFFKQKNWDPKKTPIERFFRLHLTRIHSMASFSKKDFEPRLHEVKQISVLSHKSDINTPMQLKSDLTLNEVSNLGAHIPKGVKFNSSIAQGSRKGLEENIEKAFLG